MPKFVESNARNMFNFMVVLLLLAVPSVAKQGIGAFARASGRLPDMKDVIQLTHQHFAGPDLVSARSNADKLKAELDTEWFVLFCPSKADGVSLQPCDEARARVRQLSVLPWGDIAASVVQDSASSNVAVRFGMVDCDAESQLCWDQGFYDSATGKVAGPRSAFVVRYTSSGSRAATWEPEAQMDDTTDPQQMLQDMAAWVRKEVVASPSVRLGSSGAARWFKMAVAKLDTIIAPVLADPATALTGIALVVGQLAIVTWVIGTGFELWPEDDAKLPQRGL